MSPTTSYLLYLFIYFPSLFLVSTVLTCFILYQGEKDDKIIAVCADDPEYRHYNNLNELSPHRLAEIRRFFEDCILFFKKNSMSFICVILLVFFFFNLIWNPRSLDIDVDKKNENKEVAVNEFLPAITAQEAIQLSM